MSHDTSAELVLSPRARRAGGELERILSNRTEIARYASGEVKKKDRRAIGDIVATHPKLNTEQGVGGLIWLASFHGEPINRWMNALIEEYSFSEVMLVIEFLYDKGVRTGGNSTFAFENEKVREYVPILLDTLQLHKELDEEYPIHTVEQLDALVDALGGIEGAADHDTVERIQDALDEHRSGSE